MRTELATKRLTLRAVALAILAASIAHPASAHGAGATPSNIATSWVRDPIVLVGVLASGAVYFAGYFRTAPQERSSRSFYFVLALESLVVALCSPIEALSGALVSGHMIQHIILISVTAPLFALAAPISPFTALVPAAWKPFARGLVSKSAEIGRKPEALVLATVLSTVTLWVWHLPVLYDNAVRSNPIHGTEHIALIVTSALFWGAVLLNPRPFALVAVFFGALQCTLLGVLMMVANHNWYSVYDSSTIVWGLTPLQDQQLAGVLMWVLGSFVYLLATAWLFLRMLSESDEEGPTGSVPVAGLEVRRAG